MQQAGAELFQAQSWADQWVDIKLKLAAQLNFYKKETQRQAAKALSKKWQMQSTKAIKDQ